VLEVWEYIASFAFTTWAVFTIVLRDERKLSPEQLARAWPIASRNLLLVFAGVLALPVHYARTRRSVPAFFLGLLLAIVVTAVNTLLLGTLEFFVGEGG